MEIELPEIFIGRKPFVEHQQYYDKNLTLSEDDSKYYEGDIYFKSVRKKDFCCFRIDKDNKPYTSYYIGIDWLSDKQDKAIYIQPKLNQTSNQQIDYVKMLFSLLRHPETLKYVNEVYEIKWDKEFIEIPEKLDKLTPLLIVQYLQVLHLIVKKGLKKSYYKVENNLYGKVKGKVMVASTIKHNLLKNKPLNTFCSYEEFGVNGLENRLLKRALVFVQRYLSSNIINSEAGITQLLNFINPAFENVSDEVELQEVRTTKVSAIYKDYEEGIILAKRILKKFGYNISNASKRDKIKTPPFWIDMSKLFELYVLGMLKDEHGSKVIYHFSTYGNELDYLLVDRENSKVIDAKYKSQYVEGKIHEDIRQVSGYARLKAVYDKLEFDYSKVIECLIIYPDQSQDENLMQNPILEIPEYIKVKKQSVKLPVI